MRDYTFKEKTRITAGAVTALVIVVWLAIVALAILSVGLIENIWRHLRNFVLLRRTTD